MKESEIIEHEGIIESIDATTVNVRIVSESACSSCHAKGACSAADLQDKLIEINATNAADFSNGQKVIIVGKSEQGTKAALFAYIIPSLIIIASMLITYSISGNDILSGIIGLGILVPYFGIISLLRNNLQKTFSFTLKSF